MDEPQPGELWLHSSWGPVEIVRKWDETEFVCNTDGGRKLLRKELMTARLATKEQFDDAKKQILEEDTHNDS